MEILSKDTKQKLKRAAVIGGIAFLSAFSLSAQNQQTPENGRKYDKEFKEFVSMLEKDGKTDMVEKIKQNEAYFYDFFVSKLEAPREDGSKQGGYERTEEIKAQGDKTVATSRETIDDTFSVRDLTPKGLEVYNALMMAKSLQAEVNGRNKSMARTNAQLDVAVAMLKIKHSEPELYQEIIQQTLGNIKYDEKEGTVSIKGKDNVEYYRHTRAKGEKALPNGALFRMRQETR